MHINQTKIVFRAGQRAEYQIRTLAKNPGQEMSSIEEKKLRRPGIEPGSTAWKAAMLTIIPPTPRLNTIPYIAHRPFNVKAQHKAGR